MKNSDSFQILKIIEQHSILFIKKQFVKNIQKCDLGALKWKKLGKTQNSIFIKFLTIFKIHKKFCENPRIIFVLFSDVHKENMFTINLEDGREAPFKASNFYMFTFQ